MYSVNPLAEEAHRTLDWLGSRPARRFIEQQGESVVGSSPELLALLAQADIEAGNLEVARESVYRALAIDPVDPTSLAVLAMLETRLRRAAGSSDGILELWNEALNLDRPSWLAYLNAPPFLASLNDEERAVGVAQKARVTYSNSPHCALALMTTCDHLCRADRADRALAEVAPKFDSHHAVLTSRASRAISRLHVAEALARRAQEAAPEHAGPKSLLSTVLSLQVRLDEAEAAAMAALAIQPNLHGPMQRLASIALYRGQKDIQATWKQRAMAVEPGSPTSQISEILTGASTNPYETYQRLLELEKRGPDVVAREVRFNILIHLGGHSFVKLRKLLDAIEADENRSMRWYVHKGHMERDPKQPERAIRIYREGLERYPGDGGIAGGLLGWLGLCKRKEEFIQEIEAIRREPLGSPRGVRDIAVELAGQRHYRLAHEFIDRAFAEFPGQSQLWMTRCALHVQEGKIGPVLEDLKGMNQDPRKHTNLIVRTLWRALTPPYSSR